MGTDSVEGTQAGDHSGESREGGRIERRPAPDPEALLRLEAMAPDERLSPSEAGRVLGCTGKRIKFLVRSGCLTASRLANGYWRIRAEDLRNYLSSRADALRRRILVADTDPKSIEFVRKSIERHGGRCILVHNPQEAVNKAVEIQPALVILNVSCGGFAGPSLAATMRETRTIRNVPLLLLSSSAEIGEVGDWALEAGAAGFLRWPIEEDAMVREIENIVGASW